jgi:hypothetical protein
VSHLANLRRSEAQILISGLQTKVVQHNRLTRPTVYLMRRQYSIGSKIETFQESAPVKAG